MSYRIPTLLALIPTLVSGAAECFRPNGTVASLPWLICDPTAEVSSCCAPGDLCGTNGLCKFSTWANNNFWTRGGCTDQTFQSDACPKHCYNSTTDDTAANGGRLVHQCTTTTYCCAYGQTGEPSTRDCCNDTSRLFDAGPGNYLGGVSFSIAPLATSTSTSTATSLNSSPTTTSTPATTSAASSGLSTGAKAGIGVGVALLVLGIIGVGAFLFMKRRKKQAPPPPYEGAGLETQQKMKSGVPVGPLPRPPSIPRAELAG